ncbi:hypothetical protein FACS1894103_6170 [Campylobacterota bacterium]|nr:hypothetical protein FACS1894103_6170 [Campylobacterota bacterium]
MKMWFRGAVIVCAVVAVCAAGDVQDGLDALKKRDYAQAQALWKRACVANEPKACYNLSLLYRDGLGVKADATEQTRLLEKACNGKHEKACSTLADIKAADIKADDVAVAQTAAVAPVVAAPIQTPAAVTQPTPPTPSEPLITPSEPQAPREPIVQEAKAEAKPTQTESVAVAQTAPVVAPIEPVQPKPAPVVTEQKPVQVTQPEPITQPKPTIQPKPTVQPKPVVAEQKPTVAQPAQTTQPKPAASGAAHNPYDGMYAGGRLNMFKYKVKLGGDVFEGSESKSVTPLSLVVGKTWDMSNDKMKFRAEGELVTEQKNTAGDSSVKTTALMFNGYLDFRTNSRATPYIGLGLGFAQNKYSVDECVVWNPGICYARVDGSGSDTAIANQLMFGANIEINPKFLMDIGYKIANYGKVSGDVTCSYSGGSCGSGSFSADTSSTGLYFGGHYKF